MTTPTTTECNICAEKHNKLKHAPIKCEYCDFEACRQCCQTYILDKTQATCMNNQCNKEWSRKFLAEKFTQKFVTTDWKKKREQVLFDKEKALLPATQAIVERRTQENKIKSQIQEIETQIRELERTKYGLRRMLHDPELLEHTTHTRHFIRACPDEHCRGYLSSQWKCGLCDQWTCPDCYVLKGPHKDSEHVCNKDDLETAKLLAKDTKPCPKCATGIFKIEGCDQMWCTQCHTAFSWRTGRIETRIHNPHYFEFLRRANNGDAPRNPDEHNFVCGQELDYRTTTRLKEILPKEITKETRYYLTGVIQSTIHMNEVQTPTYRVDDVENNQELRVKYLQNIMDESRFKQLVQQANKKHEKKREIGEILGLFHQTMTEIILRLVDQLKNDTRPAIDVVENHVAEIKGLQTYANTCLKEIAKTYGCKPKMIKFYESSRRDFNNYNPDVLHNREVLISV